ncbi:hypothetical protein [Halobacillus sp. Marseille-Q1614]|uniref:hypothetical protein n=1 Tax=Halobacillus sp. Marseille-Q1614 TaxID=2709134 RepID=UPI0015711C07|nr:hypothetical protein [Halobacillus sp. Marseille-Q1614]
MKKRWIFSAIGAAAGGTAAFFLKDEGKRQQVMDKAKAIPGKFKKTDDLPIEEAGNPEEQNHENSKMVSEGSQFGVQYYNDLTEKEREIIEKSNS